MILLANVVFAIGSLIGALAVNIRMLIAGRVLQGIGGGGMLSLVYTIIGDMFSQRYEDYAYNLGSLLLETDLEKRSRTLLWHHRYSVGSCWRYRADPWRSFRRIRDVEMVFLD